MANNSTNRKSGAKSGFTNRVHQWLKDEHAVGLDVHDGRIMASHFVEQKEGPVLNVLATQAYNPTLSDRELAHTIRTFWKSNNLPTRTVCSSINTHSLIVRAFAYTNVLHDELPRVLALEAEEALQLPVEEISLSWHLNAQTEGKSGISGVLVAAPKHTVKQHIDLIKAAGLYPVNVEISCSAVVNLIDFLTPDENQPPICLVNLSSRTAGIVILSGGAAYPRFILSRDETGWQNNMDYLVSNIESALLHYQLKVKGAPISKLLLTSWPRQIQFEEQLGKALSLPLETWSPFADGNILKSRHLKKKMIPAEMDAVNLSAVLGLGLRYPKKSL